MSTTYDITVVEHDPDKPDLKTTFSGRGPSAAAMLRALANEIDPPRPVMRGRREPEVLFEPGYPIRLRGGDAYTHPKEPSDG